MIAELKSHLGVSCVRCGELILVSAKVISLQEEIENGETTAPHAFVARCRVCEYESVYEIKDVQRFDGEPPRRHGRARATAA
jgi:hypothetical protein